MTYSRCVACKACDNPRCNWFPGAAIVGDAKAARKVAALLALAMVMGIVIGTFSEPVNKVTIMVCLGLLVVLGAVIWAAGCIIRIDDIHVAFHRNVSHRLGL